MVGNAPLTRGGPLKLDATRHFIDAIAFAADKHRHQRRKDIHASPYINHPIALAHVLTCEAGIADPVVLAAAILHDTLEDTKTLFAELEDRFGLEVATIVQEVSDDKNIPTEERKRLQIEHAAQLSKRARLVKLADKICTIRDVASNPPVGWSLQRRRKYFDWAKAVVDRMRGIDEVLERLFDAAYVDRP